MIKIVLILFFIGHVFGDYYLSLAKLESNKGDSFNKLLSRSVLYMLPMILIILPVFSIHMLKWAFIISFTHFVVDFITFSIKKKMIFDHKLDTLTYLLNQFVYVLIIAASVTMIYLRSEPIHYLYGIQNMVDRLQIDVLNILSWILILLTIIKPFSIIIKKTLYRYKPINTGGDGHPNAGALIGILERCIILLFLSIGQYSAIGFVLTAKSIARYNKIADDPEFSEYYLLGTLLSALLVIVAYLMIF